MHNILKPTWPAPPTVEAFMTLRSYPIDNLTQVLPKKPVLLTQIHSNIVVPASLKQEVQADAVYTFEANLPCVVLTADCLPILMCNRDGTKVAAIHAGWRGLASGIIENTFNAINGPQDEWLIWLGPAIGPNYFEVGKDVLIAFTTHDPEAHVAFKQHSVDKWYADLFLLAKQRLIKLGITHIFGGNCCTYAQPELFYSYRREKNQPGRMMSIIWRK